MIQLTRNVDPQVRMPNHGIIIDRDPAIGGHNLALLCYYERIDFQRPGFNTAGGGEELSNSTPRSGPLASEKVRTS